MRADLENGRWIRRSIVRSSHVRWHDLLIPRRPTKDCGAKLVLSKAHIADYGSSASPCDEAPPTKEGDDTVVVEMPVKHGCSCKRSLARNCAEIAVHSVGLVTARGVTRASAQTRPRSAIESVSCPHTITWSSSRTSTNNSADRSVWFRNVSAELGSISPLGWQCERMTHAAL